VRAHPELGVGARRVGVPGGEARDEGGVPAPAPLVVLHRAAQPQQPPPRLRGRRLRVAPRGGGRSRGLGLGLRRRRRRRVLHWAEIRELGGLGRVGGRGRGRLDFKGEGEREAAAGRRPGEKTTRLDSPDAAWQLN